MTIKTYDFLQTAYDELEFTTSAGFYQISDPVARPDNIAHMSWFELAQKLKAESIFFVQDYPTVLFFDYHHFAEIDIEKKIHDLHLQVWNTSRIPIFVVALLGELRIYSAYQKPVRDLTEWQAKSRWLAQINEITQIAKFYNLFSRPAIESGALFQAKSQSFKLENRVDQWLLKNLRSLRKKLEGSDKKNREYAHALIGRSIFIRYLEARDVLVSKYFADINPKYEHYVDVLANKQDTYQLFHKLREDFNGDLFPLSKEEESAIQETDLRRLADFLRGRSLAEQPDLLFWAYQFDIIPIELISNIYEEFYHEHSDNDDKGTHYTPTTLVDFVLSECLTSDKLNDGATVLDPACGSGIFLVEAFKRMVFHESHRQQIATMELPRETLLKLLTERIFGIDVNESAIQVAAFSLYLAFLDFRKPADIQQNKLLPKLVYDESQQTNGGHNLFYVNTFCFTPAELIELQTQNQQLPILPIANPQFDVILGNPPWGKAKGKNNLALEWCQAFNYPVGNKELSQCFMWRVSRLLKPNGKIGLLVLAGAFLKHGKKSKAVRQQWLKRHCINAVYNFTHVRKLFFKGGIAPFVAIFFTLASKETISKNIVLYVSIKRKFWIEKSQAVVFDKTDLHKIRQIDFLAIDWLWKAYMWGGLRDIELIGELKSCYLSLQNFISESGLGFTDTRGEHHTDDLEVSHELPKDSFDKNLPFSELIVPIESRTISVIRRKNLYKGIRFIVKHGISQSGFKFGEIQARLANISFAFTGLFIGFRIDSLSDAQQKILLGIISSSLAKYYHFLTCSRWGGLWHDTIDIEEHLSLPINFPTDPVLEDRVINAVDNLMANNDNLPLFDPKRPDWFTKQKELDEAIFDLYELSAEQRDLVRDLCEVTLEFFYEGTKANAIKPPTLEQLTEYRDAFLEIWHERLATRGKALEPQIYAPHHGLLVGMSFELKNLGEAINHEPIVDSAAWQHWFRELAPNLRQEHVAGIYIDNVIKHLTDSSIFIIKRAERRLWTKSQARQDADEFLTEVFKLEWLHQGDFIS